MTKFKKIFFSSAIILLIIAGIAAFYSYKIFLSPNTNSSEQNQFLYIPTKANFNTVIDSLAGNNFLKNEKYFKYTAKIKKYNKLIKPGKYKIENNISNWQLINKLRSGNQTAVNVIIPSIRTLDKFCYEAAKKLELNAKNLYDSIISQETLAKYNVNKENVRCLFIPNTYEIYWNTSVPKFIDRMYKEYTTFWTQTRKQKAKKLGLTPIETTILASIVQAEQMQHPNERPTIAGLYLNRLKKNIPLQSDPTLVYAYKDFSIQRIYDSHKKINSPYNTYQRLGLPPGPILFPDISSIDAVLNAEKHNYLYMCAKEDLSGYHYFSTNLSQHIVYAKRYHNTLNRLNIR